ncbi:PASTA domain, binds beta-lactams [Parafrankia irregularis]|uniref:PASTA domain, binds beta-lactams n=1 Tax=Parafrankia irregularis TaxID=795642 RepID=A0A0S4QJJ3_9ACTN|nr:MULTISPECIES: PASTA domain-containing protein [Parafrankia]MBE3204119.1 PASTA domain-containing protein [Parafrankia sp. CH37]CUU55004.1 PASTA domain, binds beta-lactams [Parafrankia irregularis]
MSPRPRTAAATSATADRRRRRRRRSAPLSRLSSSRRPPAPSLAALRGGGRPRTRLALAVLLLVGVAAVSTGTGYRASQAVLGDASTYLPSGHTVAHVNGLTGEADAQVQGSLAAERERLQTVEVGGQLYVVNQNTGVLSQVDTAAMTASPVPGAAPDGSQRALSAGGGSAYLTGTTPAEDAPAGSDQDAATDSDASRTGAAQDQPDSNGPSSNGPGSSGPGSSGPAHSSVSRLGGGGGIGAPVHLDGRIVGQAADSTGTLWVLLEDGRLAQIRGSELLRTVNVGLDNRLGLTLVHDRPVVVRADAGEVVLVRSDGGVRTTPVRLPAGAEIQISAPSETAGALWLVVVPRRQMIRVDVEQGTVGAPIALGSDGQPRYGRPLEAYGRLYVPDTTHQKVLWLDAATPAAASEIAMPAGSSGDIELKIDGGRLWINNQYASWAATVSPDGTRSSVNKGDGSGPAGTADAAGPAGGAGTGATGPPAAAGIPSTPPTQPSSTPRAPVGRAPSSSSPAPPAPSTRSTPPAPQPAPAGRTPPTGGGPVGQSPAGGPANGAPSRTTPAVPTVTVPDVRGQQQTAACAALRAVRLECRPVASGQLDGGTVGTVISTDPAPGSQVQERYIVEVRYRDRAQVPDLAGRDVTAACKEVTDLGLTCTPTAEGLANAATGLNLVTRQDPAAKSPLDRGGQVRLVYPDKVAVPSEVGTDAAGACGRLAAAGFTACTATDLGLAPAGTTPGVVIDQQPVAGSAAGPADPITVRYYGGAPVAVPNVVGMDPATAAATITAAGLTPVPSTDYPTNQPNSVLAQDPAAGTAVAPQASVTYAYEDAAPVPLYLHKRNGEPYYLLSTNASEAGYTFNRQLGSVFSAASPGGGTTAVYRSRCDSACGKGTTYYFSMNPNAQPGYVNEGIAFYTYAAASRPAGTLQVDAMFDPGDVSWVWAVNPSGAYSEYAARGYTSYNFVLGYIWP